MPCARFKRPARGSHALPPLAAGVAFLGCDYTLGCRAWIGGDSWHERQAIVHEVRCGCSAWQWPALPQFACCKQVPVDASSWAAAAPGLAADGSVPTPSWLAQLGHSLFMHHAGSFREDDDNLYDEYAGVLSQLASWQAMCLGVGLSRWAARIQQSGAEAC